jgi:hypothetical protein
VLALSLSAARNNPVPGWSGEARFGVFRT